MKQAGELTPFICTGFLCYASPKAPTVGGVSFPHFHYYCA